MYFFLFTLLILIVLGYSQCSQSYTSKALRYIDQATPPAAGDRRVKHAHAFLHYLEEQKATKTVWEYYNQGTYTYPAT